MKLRAAALALFLPLTTVAGCAGTSSQQGLEIPAPPVGIADLDHFAEVLNRFVLVPPDDPQRGAYRDILQAYLVGYVDQAVSDGRRQEALSALEYLARLYTPSELRASQPQPGVVRAARRIYVDAARKGAEQPALLALAMEQHFGTPARRDSVLERWRQIEEWLVRNSNFAQEPLLRHEELEQSLEGAAAVFPSPFVTQRLADLYIARYRAAQKASKYGEIGTAARHRMDITGYLLIRSYLRADRLDLAANVVDMVELDLPSRKLRGMVVDAQSKSRSARPLLALADQFLPEPGSEPEIPPVFQSQGWGIVANLAARAIARYPEDPYAHVLRAHVLSEEGLIDAAISELERAVAIKEDIFVAWQQLAILKHESLDRLASQDPGAARGRLKELEGFHQRAVKLWRDRPLKPNLSTAYFAVAESLYHDGQVDDSEALLERSLSIEPGPASLDLLGTIALKRSKLANARQRYEALTGLPYGDETARLRWEARAHQRLGEISLREGHQADSDRQLRGALRQLNRLLSSPALTAGERADGLVDRGQVLFTLGERNLAMQDFQRAREATPAYPRVYAEPLLFLVSRGLYPEARAVFQDAARETELAGDLKLYFALWLNDLAMRETKSPDPEASSFVADFSGERWPELLASHARGEKSYQDLLRGAGDRGERAEAHFYEALRLWRRGDLEGARSLLRQVLQTEMMSFFEYEMAQAYLRPNALTSGSGAPDERSRRAAAERRATDPP